MLKHQYTQLNKISALFTFNIQWKVIWSSILGTMTYFTGCESSILQAIAILILIDTVFGIASAIKNKKLQSWGILMYMMIKIFIYLGLISAFYQATAVGFPVLFRDVILFLIATTEIISILESASILGFRWAKPLISKINKEVEEKLNK